MPKLDLSSLPVRTGSTYPATLAAKMAGRSSLRLSDAAGLTQFGANLVRLEPGAMSSLRHWHETQDELVFVTEGALILRDDFGDTPLAVGDCATFPAGEANGHHILNLSDAPGSFLVIGTRTDTDTGWYPDLDLKVTSDRNGHRYTRRDGSPLDPENS
ncbi:cupin domain-containing protein [Puniceibacterium sediminis]|uniref:Uncharacterized conserved protein, cupin superfamily n=1 Tax=Puniceibacterium sediminis TaxID=1608407 RepID=A0A238XUZ4_9RHOB|nr:cupin domain-containing protein [Puniceibacterium sediminis]SNR62757.1 Uncharacterized conserved protein, cupin superfamily [Puniceibacterium sediminis]